VGIALCDCCFVMFARECSWFCGFVGLRSVSPVVVERACKIVHARSTTT